MALTDIFAYNIDLVKNILLNAKLNPLSTTQRTALSLTTSDEGYCAWDTTDKAFYFWTGTAWTITGYKTFLALQDTPTSYVGQSGNIVRVNTLENALEFHTLVKADLGLGSVDNTSDINKPISTATQTALNLKYNATNPSGYISTISGIAAGGELSGTYANPSLVNSAVTGKILSGLNITGGTITSTDSILTAFGKVQSQISAMVGGVIYQGVWNASTNSPTIVSSTGTKGNYYVVSVAGTTSINGITDWKLGDWIIFNGSTWDKVDNTDAVSSVNGFTGAVSLTTSNITEGSNLYYTNARGIGSTLTGYISGTGTISSADTLLSAIQKLNGNDTTFVNNTTNTTLTRTGSGPYTLGLNLANANTWSALQTFSASISATLSSSTTSNIIYYNTSTGAFTYGVVPASGVSSITGTTNQVIASASTGAVTLSLPQSINTTAAVTFGSLIVNGSIYNSGTHTIGPSATQIQLLPSQDALLYVQDNTSGASANIIGLNIMAPNITGAGTINAVIGKDSSHYGEMTWSNNTLIFQTYANTYGMVFVGSDFNLRPTNGTTFGITGALLGKIILAGNGSGAVTINPAAAAGTWTLTLPTTGGTNNYALTTNGSGVTTWTSVQLTNTNLTSLAGLTYASTSFVKMTAAGTFALDINTYLTTASAGTTYLPLAGGTMTGNVIWTGNNYLYSNATSGGTNIDTGVQFAGGTKVLNLITNNITAVSINSSQQTTFSAGVFGTSSSWSGQISVRGLSTPASGLGAEISWDGTNSYLISYNRTGSAWLPLFLGGSTQAFQIGGVTKYTIDGSGNNTWTGSGSLAGQLVLGPVSSTPTSNILVQNYKTAASFAQIILNGVGNFNAIGHDASGNMAFGITTGTAVNQVFSNIWLTLNTNTGAAILGTGTGTASLKIDGGNSGTGGSVLLISNAGSAISALGNHNNILGGGYNNDLTLYGGATTNGKVEIYSNAGLAVTFNSTQQAIFSGPVIIGVGGTGGGGANYLLINDQNNTASRSWRLGNDFTSFGDFHLQISTTQTGSTYSDVLTFNTTLGATFVSTLGINGVSNNIKDGTYTPTIVSSTNNSSCTSLGAVAYSRVGNTVTCILAIQFLGMTIGTATQAIITVPINSNMSNSSTDAAGAGSISASGGSLASIWIAPSGTANQIVIRFVPLTTVGNVTGTFTYIIN